MSKLKPNFYRLTGLSKTSTYIETRTLYGLNLKKVIGEYKNIYSIGIEKKLIELTKKNFDVNDNVEIVEGDDSIKFSEKCVEIKNEATFYLDAFCSVDNISFKEEATTLISELETVFNRKNMKDIVLINNSKFLQNTTDRKGFFQDHKQFNSIRKVIPEEWKILQNDNNSLSYGKKDQLIVCNISLFRIIMIKIYQFCYLIYSKFKNYIKSKLTDSRRIARHYFYYFIKLLLPDRVYQKMKSFLRYKTS